MSQPIPLSRLGSPTHRSGSPHDVEGIFSTIDGSTTDLTVPGPPWKRSLHAVLEQPASSPAAFIMHVFSTSLIVLSALVTILETIPTFHSISGRVWFGLETSLVALFTVEYIARTIAWSGSWPTLLRWMTSFYGIIDLLAILPYYIEIAAHQDTSTFFRFSILRTFRLLRVFRPFRNNNAILLTIEVMILSFRRSQHALLALSFFVVMVLIVFSTLLYFIERGTWDPALGMFIDSEGVPTQFASIPAAAWFVLTTISTVGYGEITPNTFFGRLVTIPLLIFGLLLIALPTFVLGREFSLVWDIMSQQESEMQGEALTPAMSSARPRRPSFDNIYTHPNNRGMGSAELDYREVTDLSLDLSKQLSELQTTVLAQGELIRRLLNEFEGKAPS